MRVQTTLSETISYAKTNRYQIKVKMRNGLGLTFADYLAYFDFGASNALSFASDLAISNPAMIAITVTMIA